MIIPNIWKNHPNVLNHQPAKCPWSLGDSSAIFEPTNVTVLPREDGETGLGTSRLLTAQGTLKSTAFLGKKAETMGFYMFFAIGSGGVGRGGRRNTVASKHEVL